MVLAQGNNMMTKINKLKLGCILLIPVILSACSDKEDAADVANEPIQQQEPLTPTIKQKVMETTSVEVHLQDLMHHVAQEERHANKYGYVWSVTEALIVKGYAEAEKGNEKIAKQLFYEAKLQFEVWVEQAKYAEQNWTLLVPEEY
jgi:hypothetical protein